MSKPELILVLGSIRRGEYEAMLAAGLRLGVLLDENRHVTLPEPERFALALPHDFSKPLSALDPLLAQIQGDFRVTAVVNLREFYVRALPYVANRLGLPGLPESAVENVLNKTLMRRIFARDLDPLAAPRFQEIASVDAAAAFAQAVGYPIVLKPNNLYGSLFVRVVHDASTLAADFADIQASVAAHMATLSVPQSLDETIQVEEFISGTVHSVDCLVDARQAVHVTPVVDVLTGRDVGQAHFGHVMRKANSRLDEAVQRRMQEITVRAVAALGLRDTAAHAEFIASPKGPKLLEIAARPGGHRNHVLEVGCGIELNHQYVRMLLGHEPDLRTRLVQPHCIVTPYPPTQIAFRGIAHLDRIKALRSYLAHEVKVKPGAAIGPASQGFMSSCVVELRHSDPDVLQSDMQWLSTFPDFFEQTP